MRWRRPRPIQVVAAVCAVLAAGTVLVVFNRLSTAAGELGGPPQPQLIATVDLRLGDPVVATERGEAQAHKDLEAGLLQLQTFDPVEPRSPAEAEQARQWQQRWGVTWVRKRGASTSVTQAYVRAYNRVMGAEIARRHGPRALAELLARPGCAASAAACS